MTSNLPNLWAALRLMFSRMESAIGPFIAKHEVARIRAYLAPLIAMARKIVLLEALDLLQGAEILTAGRKVKAPAKRASKRLPSIRLWPKPKQGGPRVRQLGPPLLVRDIWREQAHTAAALHLKKVRFLRATPANRLAARIMALKRLMDHPTAAIRRLARKLRDKRKLAVALGARPLPRTRLYDAPEYSAAGALGFNCGVAFAFPNTS